MTSLSTTFQLGDRAITMTSTKRPKYRLEMDGEAYDLCNADQIRAAINSTGRYISKNGVYMELAGRDRGSCKKRKLEGVKITKLAQVREEDESDQIYTNPLL